VTRRSRGIRPASTTHSGSNPARRLTHHIRLRVKICGAPRRATASAELAYFLGDWCVRYLSRCGCASTVGFAGAGHLLVRARCVRSSWKPISSYAFVPDRSSLAGSGNGMRSRYSRRSSAARTALASSSAEATSRKPSHSGARTAVVPLGICSESSRDRRYSSGDFRVRVTPGRRTGCGLRSRAARSAQRVAVVGESLKQVG